MVHIEESKRHLEIVKKCGGNISDQKPVFYNKDSILAVPCGPKVYLYSTATGEPLSRILECENDVIGCQVDPLNESILVICSEKGEIVKFDITNQFNDKENLKLKLSAKILKKQKVPLIISNEKVLTEWESLDQVIFTNFFVHYRQDSDNAYIFASWCLKSESKTHISAFKYKSGELSKLISSKTVTAQKTPNNFTFINQNTLVVLCGSCVEIFHFSNDFVKFEFRRHGIGLDLRLTCIAPHPNEFSFVTGDSLGRMYVWRNVMEKTPATNELHWHSLPVKCLTYSKDGTYIYSGGEEAVLVKWSLLNDNKTFMPRLSQTITNISVSSNNTMLSVSTSDNKILIINQSFIQLCMIQFFSSMKKTNLNFNAKPVFTYDPRSNSLVLNGRVGHLQYLSIADDCRFLYTVDITNKNVVTNRYVVHVDVTHAKLSQNGEWLVTCEGNEMQESRIKFWNFNEIKQNYVLNTNFEFPHSEGKIVDMEYAPCSDIVVTTGSDMSFKLWSPTEYELGKVIRTHWSCYSVGKFRLMNCGPADFSSDSSLVGVAFGSILTVWDTESCTLKSSLAPALCKDEIKFVKFGNLSCLHYVVTATDNNLSSWNLVTLTKLWCVNMRITVLIQDHFSELMAAFSKNNNLFLFKPASSSIQHQFVKCSERKIVAASFVLVNTNDSLTKKSQLFYINSDQELFSVEDQMDEKTDEPDKIVDDSKTIFASLKPTSSSKSLVQSQDTQHVFNKIDLQYCARVLSAPAYSLPPASKYCFDYLKQLALKENFKDKNVRKPDNKQELGLVSKEKSVNVEEDEDDETKLSLMFNKLFQ